MALALVVAGCQTSPRPMRWTIAFAAPELAVRAAVVHTEIREGGCAGPVVYLADVRAGVGEAPVPPALAPGRWGFAGEARNATCIAYAFHCVEVDLPGPPSVDLDLARMPDQEPCRDVGCTSGVCGGSVDAGAPSGGECPPVMLPEPAPDACARSTYDCLSGTTTATAQQACIAADPSPAACNACIYADLYFTCTAAAGGCAPEAGLYECCIRPACPSQERACVEAATRAGGACAVVTLALADCFNGGLAARRCGLRDRCFLP